MSSTHAQAARARRLSLPMLAGGLVITLLVAVALLLYNAHHLIPGMWICVAIGLAVLLVMTFGPHDRDPAAARPGDIRIETVKQSELSQRLSERQAQGWELTAKAAEGRPDVEDPSFVLELRKR